METPKIKLKSIFLRVPEREYIKMKTFMLFHGFSMQQFIRSAMHYYIQAAQEAEKVQKEKDK